MRIITLLCLMLISAGVVADDKSLDSYREKYTQALKGINEKHTDSKLISCKKALDLIKKVEEKYRGSGNLDGVLIIKKVIDGAKDKEIMLLEIDESKIPEVQNVLTKLKAQCKSYDDTAIKAIQRLRSSYTKALEKQVSELTKANKIEEAVKFNNEIKTLNKQDVKPIDQPHNVLAKFQGKWGWLPSKKFKFELTSDGYCINNDGHKNKVTIEGDTITFTSYKYSHKLKLVGNNILEGKRSDGQLLKAQRLSSPSISSKSPDDKLRDILTGVWSCTDDDPTWRQIAYTKDGLFFWINNPEVKNKWSVKNGKLYVIRNGKNVLEDAGIISDKERKIKGRKFEKIDDWVSALQGIWQGRDKFGLVNLDIRYTYVYLDGKKVGTIEKKGTSFILDWDNAKEHAILTKTATGAIIFTRTNGAKVTLSKK